MNKYISFGALAISILALVFAVVGGNNQPQELGGGTRMINGLSTDSTSPSAGQVRTTTLTTTGAATLASATVTGTLTQSTSNLATTSAKLGCIQFNATSTASPGHLEFGNISNPKATTTYTTETSASVGSVFWAFGACPK